VVSAEAIAEFRINTAYSADQGNGAGAQINLVSRSGSNDFLSFEGLRQRRGVTFPNDAPSVAFRQSVLAGPNASVLKPNAKLRIQTGQSPSERVSINNRLMETRSLSLAAMIRVQRWPAGFAIAAAVSSVMVRREASSLASLIACLRTGSAKRP